MDFSDWLLEQMNMRSWSQSDLARYSGLHRQSISDYINRRRNNPDPEALNSIARGLKLQPEEVFRAAGLLPRKPKEDELADRAEYLLNSFKTDEFRQIALATLETLLEQEEKAAGIHGRLATAGQKP